MKVAIVTPYHFEPWPQIQKCLVSVRWQVDLPDKCELEHIVVSDGEAASSRLREYTNHPALHLPFEHRDWGNCARAIGALDAVARGFDAVGFLDADNWLEPTHVASLVELHRRTAADVCIASRTICRVDGSPMFEDKESDGVRHVDTNCLMLFRTGRMLGGFPLLPFWAFVPPAFAHCGDRVFWAMIRAAQLSCEKTELHTVNYRSRWALHYRALGEEPPEGAKEAVSTPGALALAPVNLFLPVPEPASE